MKNQELRKIKAGDKVYRNGKWFLIGQARTQDGVPMQHFCFVDLVTDAVEAWLFTAQSDSITAIAHLPNKPKMIRSQGYEPYWKKMDKYEEEMKIFNQLGHEFAIDSQ